MEPIILDQHALYGSKNFKSVAAKAWDVFFEIFKEDYNVAHWHIDGFSSTIGLTGRNVDIDESGPSWSISSPIFICVDGFEPDEIVPNKIMLEEFQKWAVLGILDAFQFKRILGKYKKHGLNNTDFSILASKTDEGIAFDDFAVIWSNKDRITPSKIRARQLKSKKITKRRVIKKRK